MIRVMLVSHILPWELCSDVRATQILLASPILVSIILEIRLNKLGYLSLKLNCQRSYFCLRPLQPFTPHTTKLTIILFCQLTLLFYNNCYYTTVLLLIKISLSIYESKSFLDPGRVLKDFLSTRLCFASMSNYEYKYYVYHIR